MIYIAIAIQVFHPSLMRKDKKAMMEEMKIMTRVGGWVVVAGVLVVMEIKANSVLKLRLSCQ